jgi:glucose/arabinose dehydrogenase
VLVPALPAPQAATAPGATTTSTTTDPARAVRTPRLRVRTVVRGLDNPWDVQRLPGGTLLVTERDRARLSTYDGSRSTVAFPRDRIWVSGETGLMSLEVDPRFGDNRRFYTCSGWVKQGGGHDIRVNAWRLSAGGTEATLLEALVTGFPTSTGRHGGCRLLIADNGALVVGTGDAARSGNPRDLTSLGGKTLRLHRFTGRPWRSNPFRRARNVHKRYVLTYGHRNVQGLAQRRDGSLWSVEHGSYRDDEVNLLRRGGDYGWNPGPGYDESVPMTDHSLPGRQRSAKWRSGEPTLATSGAAWVRGREWGRLRGTLAVAALKANRVVFMKFGPRGGLKWTKAPRRLRQLGRLRSVVLTPRHDLLVTTDNDGGSDKVLRITPRRRR